VTTDLFPAITGEVINAKTIESYRVVEDHTNDFCTVVPSKLIQEKFASYTAGKTPDKVLQGAPYNEAEFEEKYFEGLPSEKYGKIISVTKEMIHFDKTRQVMVSVRATHVARSSNII
jgi:hypothetical protein